MEATLELSTLLDQETWDAATVGRIRQAAFASAKELDKFKGWVRQAAAGEAKAMNVGIALCLLGEYDEAISQLKKAGNNDLKACYLGLAYREAGDYESALVEFERAAGRGVDALDAALAQVETLRRAGRRDEADKLLKKHAKAADTSAEYQYQRGCLHESAAEYGQAAECFERAIGIDAGHQGACFRLAYLSDLFGNEGEAVELYRRCVEGAAAPVSALINLAVLYEDRGSYDQAIRCLQEVLRATPDHRRARLFLKDCLSGLTQYYDEIQERARDKRTAVLEIPITDFELSVRSRNCLKKMNIHTLGDLLTVTESDLLGYKNFGETSLSEIKAVLTQKGLRLGQALEEEGLHLSGSLDGALDDEPEAQDNDILAKGVEELELSVRSRRCLERLGVRTLGDLASRTEAELMSTKNFGQTSLTEVKEQLAANGLSLRQLEE